MIYSLKSFFKIGFVTIQILPTKAVLEEAENIFSIRITDHALSELLGVALVAHRPGFIDPRAAAKVQPCFPLDQ